MPNNYFDTPADLFIFFTREGVKNLRPWAEFLTPRDHSFLPSLPSFPPKLLNPSFAGLWIPPKEIPFSRPTDGG